MDLTGTTMTSTQESGNEVALLTSAIGRAPTLRNILDFERMLTEQPNAIKNADDRTFHHFAPGMYSRELHIPAGQVLTGKMHRHAHMNFLMEGEITVWVNGGMRRLCAPYAFVSQPYTKRVGYAHTDVIWVTVHATNETDLAKIEAEVIVPQDEVERMALEFEAGYERVMIPLEGEKS